MNGNYKAPLRGFVALMCESVSEKLERGHEVVIFLIQHLLDECTDLVGPVHEMNFQDPLPAVAVFVRQQYIVVVVRVYIQAQVAVAQLLMGKWPHDMTRYLSPVLPAVSFGQFSNIVEIGCAGE